MSYEGLIQKLIDSGVEFIIIGGWSAILHGSSYMTLDLDLCYSRNSANLKRLAAVLAPYHPRLRDLPPDLPFVWDDVTLRNGSVFTLTTDIGEIDLLAEVGGVGDYSQAMTKSVRKRSWGRDVWTLDLPALIESKRAAGRAKDLWIIPELEALLEAQEPE